MLNVAPVWGVEPLPSEIKMRFVECFGIPLLACWEHWLLYHFILLDPLSLRQRARTHNRYRRLHLRRHYNRSMARHNTNLECSSIVCQLVT